MGIVTKNGDKGTTVMLSKERVSKSDARLGAIGTSDELLCALGLARSFSKDARLSKAILKVQKDVMRAASELSGPGECEPTSEKDIREIEDLISAVESEITLPKSLIVPGSTQCSSAIDLARAIARRLEREVIAVMETKKYEHPKMMVWLNRLSDYLFLLARLAETA